MRIQEIPLHSHKHMEVLEKIKQKREMQQANPRNISMRSMLLKPDSDAIKQDKANKQEFKTNRKKTGISPANMSQMISQGRLSCNMRYQGERPHT